MSDLKNFLEELSQFKQFSVDTDFNSGIPSDGKKEQALDNMIRMLEDNEYLRKSVSSSPHNGDAIKACWGRYHTKGYSPLYQPKKENLFQ